LLSVGHIGLNQEHVQRMLVSPTFVKFKEEIMMVEFKRVIIASVDRLHPIAGIRAKLEGYRHFLKQNAPHRMNVCLVQYVSTAYNEILFTNDEESLVGKQKSKNPVPLPNKVKKTNWMTDLIAKTKAEIDEIVKEIKDEFGEGCLIFKN
jgi:hypothetical protein